MSRDIRVVSGYGPRCGCGGESRLHIRSGRPVTSETSLFLCADCVMTAIVGLRRLISQPPYWPGDEGRDEAYVDPRASAALRVEGKAT